MAKNQTPSKPEISEPEIELFEMAEGLFMRSDAPHYGSVIDFMELEKLATLWTNSVKVATSSRQIVLETWLLLDYFVRHLLAGAFDLNRFSTEEFDLRYELLPQSFDRCLTLLENIYNEHLKVAEEKPTSSLRTSIGFWEYLRRNHSDLEEKLLHADKAYIKEKFGYDREAELEKNILSVNATPIFTLSSRSTSRVSAAWMEAASKLNASWFKSAKRLNKARNKAAHTTDNERILQELGIKGKDTFNKVRKECEFVIERLMGIVKAASDPS